MTGSVERKTVKSADSGAPDFLAAVGVGNGEWLFALKIYYEILKGVRSAEAWRLAMVLTPAAFSWGKWNQDYCARQGIKGPLNALLCIRELRDASGRKTGEVEPYTPKTAADDAGLDKRNADQHWRQFEKLGLFIRDVKNDGTNGKMLWASTKPKLPSTKPQLQAENKSKAVISPDDSLFLLPSNIPESIDDRILSLRKLARKPFVGTFMCFHLDPDPQLVSDEGYCAGVVAEMKDESKQAKTRAIARFNAFTNNWKTQKGRPLVIPTDDSGVFRQNGRPVIPAHDRAVIPRGDTYKEQVASTSRSTSAVYKGEQQPPAAAAAPPSKTTTTTKTNGGYHWPLTLKKAQAIFPKVSPAFVDKLAVKAQAKRPGLTDDELAGCLVKKSGQNGEGLWLLTVPELVEALNEGRNATPLTDREIIDNAKAAERARKEEGGTKWNQARTPSR